MDEKQLLKTARRRASAKFGFLIHLMVFVAVNTMLFAVNQSTSPSVSWFLFPLSGWGLGLAIHGLAVFLSGSGIHGKLVESEVRRLRASGQGGAPGAN